MTLHGKVNDQGVGPDRERVHGDQTGAKDEASF